MIQDSEKCIIQSGLQEFCLIKGSQAKASKSLIDVSEATVSKILAGEWKLISEEMWRKIGGQIGIKSKKSWNVVETRDFNRLTRLLKDAQDYSLMMAVIGNCGTGKSQINKIYSDTHSNVFLITCADHLNRKTFIHELFRTMGKHFDNSDTVSDLMKTIVIELKKLENPLIILDEADKLPDNALYFLITIYNQLEDHCAIVLTATDYLEKRIRRGVRLNRKGYKEIYSRIGSKFITLHGANAGDISMICIGNGVDSKRDIAEVIKDSDNDLRRVKRKILAILRDREHHE